MYQGKPIIGIAGGIGSGKSYVARLFGELGCAVIDSDAAVRELYRRPAVIAQVRQAFGDSVISAEEVDRKALAGLVFAKPKEKQRLERLLHPLVHKHREEAMQAAVRDRPGLTAFVWDSPLLFETGLYEQCDALVFVDCPLGTRIKRVAERGWTAADLVEREKSQWPLDKKRELCNDVIVNSADDPDNARVDPAEDTRGQVGQVLSRILARSSNRP